MSDSKKIAGRNAFRRPDWTPRVPDGFRLLVIGASGGLGRALVPMVTRNSDCIVGAHYNSHAIEWNDGKVLPLQKTLSTEADCVELVEEFKGEAGGIDGLVVLSGRLTAAAHWDELNDEEWQRDVHDNLNIPFFLSRAALRKMKDQQTGGRIILNGTESALHGGSPHSFPYAVAKRGIEAMVQGLAREGAPWAVTANGVRLGYFRSGFHQRWLGRTEKDLEERAELVPVKRGGEPEEAAALISYLLSDWAGFITGQMVAATGGDWL